MKHILGSLLSVLILLSLPAQAQTSIDASLGGAVIPGYDSRSCDGTIEGAIRYNSSSVTIAATDYVHYWTLDETSGTTVNDSAGSSNGTWNGSAAVSSVDGQIGTAFNFDGTDDYVSIPDAATLETQTDMSLSLWVKYDAASLGTDQILLQKDHSVSPWLGWALGTSATNYPYFYFAATDASYWDVGPSIVFADQWYHFVGVKSGNDLEFYVNGARNEAFNDSPVTSTFQTSTDGPLGLGSDPSSMTDAFDGVMDDIRLYDRALSQSEIFSLFEEGLNGGPSGSGCVEYCNGSSWVCPNNSGGGGGGSGGTGGSGTEKIVFVTSSTYDGNIGGTSGADSSCNTAASNAGLSGTYMAWLSVENTSTDPESRFTQASVPYRLVDGTKVADNWSDLVDGTLDNAINIDENSNSVASAGVWTNTMTNGTPIEDTFGTMTCATFGNNSGAYASYAGTTSSTTSTWTNNNSPTCSNTLRLYCFEQ